MQDPHRFEPATDESFEEGPYLLANPDVARHVAAGADAWDHFNRHGRREGRRQLTPAAAGLDGSRNHRKYRRFAALLDAGSGADGQFRFIRQSGAFPVAYGDAAHRLEDYEAESANPGFADFIDEIRTNPDRLYMDVGCGRRARRYDNCLYLDVYPSVSADIVMQPACRYPIASGSLDGIGCFAVLEHVPEPWTVAAEFRRMLKPGGLVFIDYPFLVPVHGYPSHYYNATRAGLARLFDAGFDRLRLDTLDNQTPGHALHWQLNGLLGAITQDAVRDDLAAMTVAELCAEDPAGAVWRRVMDALPDAARQTYAAGNTLVARKR